MGVQFSGNILVQANGGPLPISQGGTGQTTAPTAINALLPVQTGQSGKILITDGVNVSWSGSAVNPGGADTQIQFNDSGTFGGSSNFVINKSTGAITAASTIANAGIMVTNAAGTLRQLKLQTAGSDRWLLQANNTAESGASAGSNFEFVSVADNGATQNQVFTVSRSNQVLDFKAVPTVNGVQMGMGAGTVTSVDATGSQGVTISGVPITTTGTISVGLGNITPTSVAATGTVTGSNLSGTNTGDQTITLTGDVTGTGTGSFATTLATVNASPQTDTFRKHTINAKGLTTATSAVTSSDITTALGFTPVNKAGDTMSGALTATQFNGSGAGLTSIPNGALTNSSVTVGSTNIALGATATTLAGLTSVTSTGFIGALTGNATTVTNGVYTTDIGTVTNTMLAGSIANAKLLNSSTTIGTTAIALGASSTTLAGLTSVTSTSFTGALTGNATTATSATTATTATNIAAGVAGNVHYQSGVGATSFVTNAAGVLQAATSGATPAWTTTPTLTGTNFSGIPNAALTNSSTTIGTTAIALGASSTTLAGLTSVTSTSFTGALTGNASTVTNGVYTTDIGTVTNTMLAGSIANAKLTNSSVTVGTTAIALGASSTTLGGLTSVTSTSFVGALTGNASTVTNGVYTTDTGTVTNTMLAGSIANAKLLNSSTTIGTTAISLGATSTTLAGLTSVTSTSFTGALTGNATTVTNGVYTTDTGTVTNTMLAGSIANAKLLNSSTTIGTTAIALGASSTTLGGLTSVTSTSFTGALTGNASTATTLATARNISASGDATWTVSFNGSADATAALTLATVNASPQTDTFRKHTINAKGLTTATSAVVASDITTALGYTPVNKAGDTMTGLLILSGDPTNVLGATTKQYVDNMAAGVNIHASCETSTTAALAACTYSNGTAGVGATLTASANGLLGTIGGYATLVVGSRLLVKDQAAQLQNGIYTVTSLGSAGTPWVLTRATDFDGSPTFELSAGDLTYIQEGTLGGSQWVETAIGTGSPGDYIIVGTNPIVFSQFAGSGTYSAGTGINIAAGVISNAGVLSFTSGTGLSTNTSATGAVSVTNTGVTSAVAGTNISVSGATGAVTISVTGTVAAATNATNVGVTNDVATATAVYPTWVTANTGNLPSKVSSTKLSFVPSTGALTATTFIGALTGNASTATSIAGGAATQVPYQTGAGVTAFSSDFTYDNTLKSIAIGNSASAGTVFDSSGSITQGASQTNAVVINSAPGNRIRLWTTDGTGGVRGGDIKLNAGSSDTNTGGIIQLQPGLSTSGASGYVQVVGSIGYLANGGSIAAGTTAIDFAATGVFNDFTLAGNATFTFANPVPTGYWGEYTFRFAANPTAYTVTWPAAVTWATGTAPVIPTTGSTTITLVSTDGGTTYLGTVLGNVTTLNDTTTNATYYPTLATTTAGQSIVKVSSSKLSFNPSTGVLAATTFSGAHSGSGAGLTSIPNSALTNSSVTVGTTAIALGASSTTLAGLTSVTSTTFVGALTGNASTATSATTAGTVTTAAQPSITSVGTLSALSVTGTSSLSRINLNTASGGQRGISWYNGTYTAWVDYMANAATTTNGPTGTLTAPTGTLVTSWGRRSFVENIAGYGWTFESGTSASTTPAIVAEIRSSDGAAKFGGTVTAPTFVGALTGNASTATSATSATTAGSVTNAVTFNNSGTGAASGTTYNGGAAQTISYNTVGASPLAGSASLTTTGTVTSGTWSGSFGAVSGANLTNITGANVTGTVANATTAVNATNTTITDDVATATTVYPTWASSNTGNLPRKVSSTKLSFVPSTGVLSATTFSGAHSGSGAGLTAIPNSALTNSSVTVGATAIALGAAATTITGLTSVTSTTFVGALTGNASTATTAGTVTTAAQPNITSVGTMTGLTLNRTAGTGVGVVYQSSATNIWSVGRGVWSGGNDFEWYDMVNVTKPVWISSTTGALNATSFSGSGAGLTSIPNTALTNSSITVNGTAIALGASGTVTAAAGTLTGTTLAAGVTASSLTSVGTLASLAVTGTTTVGGLEVGTKILPQVSQSVDYTLVLSDSGKHILHPSADTTARTFTIPANASVAYPVGTSVTFINQNGGGAITIAITTDTMRLAGAGTTGSRTLTANGVATAVKIATTEWIIFGTNLT